MIDEKQLGSLFITGFRGSEITRNSPLIASFSKHPPGGVILFDRCVSDPAQTGNIVSPTQLRNLTGQLSEQCDTDHLLICVDQEGGMVKRLKKHHGFPETASPAEMGKRNSPQFTAEQAEITAETLSAAGINVNFAPTVDLNTNPENPIIGTIDRSFSAFPDLVVRHAAIWIQAHHHKKIISCLKHFPGHGSSTTDSHLGFVDITNSWNETELEPYRTLLDTVPLGMVMVGHLYNHRIDAVYPASLSRLTIQGILRDKLGYRGVIVTDDLQMNAITEKYGFEEAICHALSAGCDMLVIGNNLIYEPDLLSKSVQAVVNGLDQGLLSEALINDALARINTLKQSMRDKHK